VVTKAYAGEPSSFGPEYLIPKPFDPRLITKVAPAVARAAMDSGVAVRPIEDLRDYEQHLSQFVYKSSGVMEPIFDRARESPRRVCYAEGENDNVLHAAQQVIDGGIARPVLVGNPEVIERRIRELKLRIHEGEDYEVVYPAQDPRLDEFCEEFYRLKCRQGVSPARAGYIVRSRSTAFSALMVKLGYADALLCGTVGPFQEHLERVNDIIGKAPQVSDFSSLVVLILPTGTFFICDTHVTYQPSAPEIAEMATLAAAEVKRFGIVPKLALVSHSNFGNRQDESSAKMQEALRLLREQGAGPGSGWRDARRRRRAGRHPADHSARLYPSRLREPARDAQCRRSPYFVQSAQGPGRGRLRRADSSRHRHARTRGDPVHKRAGPREHDGDRRGRRPDPGTRARGRRLCRPLAQ
jgi:malate dehydrogenase (oxaloacetate-decarboxylating)(NADP+)